MSAAKRASGERRLAPVKAPGPPGREGGGTLMVLRLGQRWFAVDVKAIVEVALQSQVTRVPTAPSHILGVATLRGRLVTVVGLEQMIGGVGMLPLENPATLPRLLVLRDGAYEMAVVAEEIHGMVEYGGAAGPQPARAADAPDFVRDEFDWQGNRVTLLDASLLVAAAARLAGVVPP